MRRPRRPRSRATPRRSRPPNPTPTLHWEGRSSTSLPISSQRLHHIDSESAEIREPLRTHREKSLSPRECAALVHFSSRPLRFLSDLRGSLLKRFSPLLSL